MVAQNWQDLLAEESNSSFDVRNKLTGNFLYELPFGPDDALGQHRMAGAFAQRNLSLRHLYFRQRRHALTPHYEAAVADVARGSTGSLRPDRVPGVSLTAGGGSLDNWFNKSAFVAPANTYGTASRLLDSRTGHGFRQCIALQDDSLLRNPYFRDARHRQQRLQYRPILRRRLDLGVGNLRRR